MKLDGLFKRPAHRAASSHSTNPSSRARTIYRSRSSRTRKYSLLAQASTPERASSPVRSFKPYKPTLLVQPTDLDTNSYPGSPATHIRPFIPPRTLIPEISPSPAGSPVQTSTLKPTAPSSPADPARTAPGPIEAFMIETFFSAVLAVLVALLFVTVFAGVTSNVKAEASIPESPGDELDLAQAAGSPLSEAANPISADWMCEVSTLFPEKVRQWCEPITRYARENGLSPDLIAALIWQESGGNAQAYSHSGAVGLMQVMPRDGKAARFMCKNGPCFSSRPTIQELYDPEFNIQWGTQFLRGLVDHHQGNLREALKSYGPMDMGHRYADIVIGLYERNREQ